jgi:hypothetical protein
LRFCRIEQSRVLVGFKRFASAKAALAGIELLHIIREGQLKLKEATPFES